MAESSIKLGRVSLSPRGTYDAAAVYNRLDVVEYEGSSYLVLSDGTTGVTPAEGQAYMLLAEKGDKGDKGDEGDKGDKGDTGSGLEVLGIYATLEELQAAHPAGSAGEAYAVGTAENNAVYVWSGDAWASIGPLRGADGNPGAAGKSAYQYAVDGGYTGTEAQFQAVMADAATKTYVDNAVTGAMEASY